MATPQSRRSAIPRFAPEVRSSRHRLAKPATCVARATREESVSRQEPPEETIVMSKPTKTEAELIAMARTELKVHADCPDGIAIFVLRSDDSWEFRAEADEAIVAKPGYPECVAMLVQIGDHLAKHYDVEG